MSQSSIDLLFEDPLMEIFSYLDAKSLKNCCEVSRKFNEIIGNHSKFMKKLPLYLSTSCKQNELKVLRRQYHTVCFEITINTNLVNKLIKLTKQEKSLKNVRVIEIINCYQVEANAFKSLLQGIKTVEKILIAGSSIDGFKKRHLVDMDTLKTFVMMESSLEFIDFIGKSKIREFKLHETRLNDKNDDILEEFFMRTSSLENLAVRVKQSQFYKCLLNDDSKEYSFKLKKMSITFESFGTGDEVDDNFLNILKQHQNTLEHLEIESKLTEEIYEYILSQMKLTTLRIDCSHLSNSHLFYNTYATNNYLQKLIITKGFSTQTSAQGFLKSYKNIRDIQIDQWTDDTSNEILISIAKNFNHLEILNIPRVPENPTELPIPSLQTLHIGMVRTAADFQAYASLHTNLRNISIKWINEDLSHETMDVVSSHLPHLESLTFGPHFELTIRMHETLRRNSPRLHTVQLFRFSHERIPKSPITLPIPKVLHFSNKSSSLVFKSEQGMWDVEDMLFNYSGEDMVISDDESFDDDYDDLDDEDEDEDHDNEDYDNDYFAFNIFNNPTIYYDPNIPLLDNMFPELAVHFSTRSVNIQRSFQAKLIPFYVFITT